MTQSAAADWVPQAQETLLEFQLGKNLNFWGHDGILAVASVTQETSANHMAWVRQFSLAGCKVV